MIIWTENGPEPRPPIEGFQGMIDEVYKRCTVNKDHMTIADFYEYIETYLKGLGLAEETVSCIMLSSNIEGEFFVDPANWGWDKACVNSGSKTRGVIW